MDIGQALTLHSRQLNDARIVGSVEESEQGFTALFQNGQIWKNHGQYSKFQLMKNCFDQLKSRYKKCS